MKLRALTAHNAEMLTNLHNDILEGAKALLKRGYFIKEEAVVAAGERKHREDIQWDAIKEELEAYFCRRLAAQSRAALRDMTTGEFASLKVSKLVAAYLQYRGPGSGNETAGYGFLGWPTKEATERLITSREHVGAGFNRSAVLLRDELEAPTPLLSKDDGEDE